jgi:hypothetical protein
MSDNQCGLCGEDIEDGRVKILRADDRPLLCPFCGEEQARQERASWCIAPMHKSNYMLFTNKADLKGINNKGGLVK